MDLLTERVASITQRVVGGVELGVATIASRTGDTKQWIEATIAAPGTAIEIQCGSGNALKLEDKSVAQSDINGVDINSFAVKTNKLLTNANYRDRFSRSGDCCGAYSAFGWHAWTEVEIDGHWVQVDPSWDEVVGSATHISLGEDAAMNLSAIKLEVL